MYLHFYCAKQGVEQVQYNFAINCMLDVKVTAYLEIPKNQPNKKNHPTILMCINGNQAYKIY